MTVTAAKPHRREHAYLEIALPKGAQRFDGIGDQFLTMKSGGRDSPLVIADLNGDGIDEIIVRGSVPPYPPASSSISGTPNAPNIFPVEFTDDKDEDKPFCFNRRGIAPW